MKIKDSHILSNIFKHGKLDSDGSVNFPTHNENAEFETPEHKLKIQESKERFKKTNAEFLRGHKDRVSHKDMHKAAEELRMEGKGSHDPMYPDSKKNG